MGVKLTKQSIDLGIVTTNGPAMLAFYREVLGFEYVREMPMPGGNGAVMHQLMCGESMIKLVVAPSLPAQAAPGGALGGSGYRYWTISVSNIAELLEACSARGQKVVVPERSLRPGVKIAVVEDPDGNWVEFLTVG
jgi:catechol 2,3-dioxygenase-like lactoylglutathione lyase family enzyme